MRIASIIRGIDVSHFKSSRTQEGIAFILKIGENFIRILN